MAVESARHLVAAGLAPKQRCLMLLQVPGGAWAVPLLNRMAALGWICVGLNYSRVPENSWPAHIIDVKRAIAWVRENIAEDGGDPDFIAVTGGSAGAHVGASAALTADDPSWQPGFEDSDASAQAAVRRGAGAPTVAYAELPNAHHAFDTLATVRSQLAAAAAAFLGVAYGRHRAVGAGRRVAAAV